MIEGEAGAVLVPLPQLDLRVSRVKRCGGSSLCVFLPPGYWMPQHVVAYLARDNYLVYSHQGAIPPRHSTRLGEYRCTVVIHEAYGARCRLTIPKKAAAKLGLELGTPVAIVLDPGGGLAIVTKTETIRRAVIRELFGAQT